MHRQRVGLDQRSCSTLSPVSTGMGDGLRPRVGKLSHYVTSHPGQLSLPSPGVGKRVSAIVGKKRQVWLIPIADEHVAVKVKLLRSLENTCHT